MGASQLRLCVGTVADLRVLSLPLAAVLPLRLLLAGSALAHLGHGLPDRATPLPKARPVSWNNATPEEAWTWLPLCHGTIATRCGRILGALPSRAGYQIQRDMP